MITYTTENNILTDNFTSIYDINYDNLLVTPKLIVL